VQHRDQNLWFHTEPDGSLSIRGRLPAEVGALFKRALEAAVDSLPIPENVPAGTFSDEDQLRRSRKRRVEALATIAETFLATGPKDLSGGDRQQIVVHVDEETFKHRHAGRCERRWSRFARTARTRRARPPSRSVPRRAGVRPQGVGADARGADWAGDPAGAAAEAAADGALESVGPNVQPAPELDVEQAAVQGVTLDASLSDDAKRALAAHSWPGNVRELQNCLERAAILCSVFGALNGNILAKPRVAFALAQDGLSFEFLGRAHARFATPHAAIWIHAAGALVLVALLRDFDTLTTYFVVVEWSALLFAVGAVLVLRRRQPDAPRPFRTPGYPWVPLFFLGGTAAGLAAIVWGELARSVPNYSPLLGLLLAATGFPVYRIWRSLGIRRA